MLRPLHIAPACFWAGTIVVQTLIELMARKGMRQELQFVARAHRIVDRYFVLACARAPEFSIPHRLNR